MKRIYRIFIIWFYGKMWLAKAIKYRIEKEKWKKVVIEYMRKKWKPLVSINANRLIVREIMWTQIRCGGNSLDIGFMDDMFPQTDKE